MTDQTHTETGVAIVAKLSPPTAVSMVSIAGYPVSDLVLWVTLFYTLLLAGHKLWQIIRDIRRGRT